MGQSGSLELRDQRFPAGGFIRDLRFSRVALTGCTADAAYENRPRIENCVFQQVRLSKCMLGTAVFRECTFDGVRSDYLDTYNALFLRCTLRGEIKGVNIGIRPDLYDAQRNAAIRSDNNRLLAEVDYCMDVREASLTGVLFQGQEVVRRIVFRPGQCALFRGTKNLAGQLKSAMASLPPGEVRKYVGRANVFPEEDSVLVALPPQGSHALLDELRRVLAPHAIDVLGEPLASV